jgi:hypothetical protein
MNTATITVKKIFPPNKGGFVGVIASDDTRFSVKGENLAGQFREGGKYEISYEESTQGQYTNRTVRTVKPLAGGASLSTIQGGKYGATDDVTAERIFCCGALNAFITAGKIEPSAEAVRKATDALRTAWRQTFGAPAAKATSAPAQTQVVQPDEPMDDEIPF